MQQSYDDLSSSTIKCQRPRLQWLTVPSPLLPPLRILGILLLTAGQEYPQEVYVSNTVFITISLGRDPYRNPISSTCKTGYSCLSSPRKTPQNRTGARDYI